jgi:hypothetical protein
MAIPKNRAKTLQEKFGFFDEDMKNPTHDRIMVWMDSHAEELVREYFALSPTWPEELVNKVRAKAHVLAKRPKYRALNLPDLGHPPNRVFQVISKTWEKPIVTANNFTVGFADLEVVVQFSEDLDYCENDHPLRVQKPVIDWFTIIKKEHVIFEAKTAIASVSEVIRQIRLYQQYQPGVYVVVSPDDRYAEVMRSQGIQFLKYEEQN